jgi:hypothetical protein
MKVDSEYIDIEIIVEDTIQMGIVKRNGIEVEIDYDGNTYFYNDKKDRGKILLQIEEVIEIGRIYKLYRDRRDFYLANIKTKGILEDKFSPPQIEVRLDNWINKSEKDLTPPISFKTDSWNNKS